MREQSERHAQESRARAISGFKLALFFIVVAAALSLHPRSGLLSLGSWLLAGLFTVVGLLELFLWMLNAHQSALVEAEKVVEGTSGDPKVGNTFELVSDNEDAWYERVVAFGDELVAVRLLEESEAFTRSLPYANAIIDRQADFALALEAFRVRQQEKYPDLADEIRDLRLDSISFWSKREPDAAEVMFKETEAGRLFGCAYRNGVFYNFSYCG